MRGCPAPIEQACRRERERADAATGHDRFPLMRAPQRAQDVTARLAVDIVAGEHEHEIRALDRLRAALHVHSPAGVHPHGAGLIGTDDEIKRGQPARRAIRKDLGNRA